MKAYVWLNRAERAVLVTDDPGVPVNMELVGSYPLPEGGGWGDAGNVGQTKARELGYRLEYDSIFFNPF